MKKPLSILLALCLLLAAVGCANDQKAVYDQFAGPSGSEAASEPANQAAGGADALSGELRIAISGAVYEDMGVDMVAKEFMKLHPDVSITFEPGMTEEEAMQSDPDTFARLELDYAQRIATELMGGSPPDLIDLNGLDVSRYTDSGMFCNYYDFPDWAGVFQEEEYYMDVLACAENGKGLFTLPTVFGVNAVAMNKEVAEALEVDLEFYGSITLEEILDIYNRAVAQGIVSQDFVLTESWTKWAWCQAEMGSFLSYGSREAKFDTPEFTAFIEALQPVKFTRTVGMRVFYGLESETFGRDTKLLNNTQFGLNNLFDWFHMFRDTGSVYIPYETRGGQLSAYAGELFSIPLASGQKELAWEFLKYMQTQLGEASPDKEYYLRRFQGLYPVKKGFAEDYFAKQLGKQYDEEKLEAMRAVLGRGKAVAFTDNRLSDVLRDILIRYFDQNLMTAGQCAKELQGRAEIYLNE